MAKKKEKKKDDDGPLALPKFGGFHPLAGGLSGFKAQLDAAQKKEEEAKHQSKPGKPGSASPLRPDAPSPAFDARRQRKAEGSSRGSGAPLEPAEGSSRGSGAPLEPDDDLSFHRMMSGVTPLDDGGRGRIPINADIRPGAQKLKAAEVQARAVVEAERALEHLHSLVDDGVRFEVSDDGRRVEGRRLDAPPDLVRSLRRGLLPVDGRLDLHGKTAAQAQDVLAEFLRTMRSRNERCVLVIHGKGERHPGAGVLRGEISAWLSQGKSREHVAAFATARDDDGGEGAVYVALRR